MSRQPNKKPSHKTRDSSEINHHIDSLAKFLDREHSEDLSEFKNSLNKGLGILVTINDDETGIPLHFFAQGEDSSILRKKAAKLDKERHRAMIALQEWVEEFERMSKKVFKNFAKYLYGRIESIKTNAEKQIEVIDTVLSTAKDAAAASGAGASTISAIEKKKSRLERFINRLSAHNEKLENARNTEELLEIETELEEDVKDFDKNTYSQKQNKSIKAFFMSLYASVPDIAATLPEIEEEQFDITPYGSTVDEEEEGKSETSDLEEELTC